MAGLSKMFIIGEPGGFMGSDGISQIKAELLVGDGSRQWIEPLYPDKTLKPLGSVKRMIPYDPDDDNMIFDACLLFLSNYFEECTYFKIVNDELDGIESVDFSLNKNVPKSWDSFRKEAKVIFDNLCIFEAEFKEI